MAGREEPTLCLMPVLIQLFLMTESKAEGGLERSSNASNNMKSRAMSKIFISLTYANRHKHTQDDTVMIKSKDTSRATVLCASFTYSPLSQLCFCLAPVGWIFYIV